MKKNLILIVTIIVLIILLISFIPSVAKGMRITKLQNQLKDYQAEYTRCEAVLLNSHSGAEAVRAKLNEELGVITVEVTGSVEESTPIEQLDESLGL